MTLLQEALAPRSDQLNGDDLLAGPRTIRITGARFVAGDRGGKKIIIHYDGENGKPWHPCKTMGRAMVLAWGVVDDEDPDRIAAQFSGKSVTLYRDPNVSFGNEKNIGGIRISHMSHIDGVKVINLTVSKGKKERFTFQPLTAEVRRIQPTVDDDTFAENTIANIGKAHQLAQLDRFIAGRLAKINELAELRPDLWQRIDDALNLRRAALATDASDAGDA